jgi:hypothetical protein
MELPTVQEKSKEIILMQPKEHQFKFAETNKTVPTDPLWLVAFFEQCQTANKATGVLYKLKEKKQPKERRRLIFLLLAAVTQTTGIIVARTMTIIKATDATMTNVNMTVAIKTINTTIILVARRRTKGKSPTRRKMTVNTITSKRGTMRTCTMTTLLHQARTLCPKKGVAPCQGLLLTHDLVLALAQTAAKGRTTMSPRMMASQAAPSSASIHTWTTIFGHVHCPKKGNTDFATFATPKEKKKNCSPV